MKSIVTNDSFWLFCRKSSGSRLSSSHRSSSNAVSSTHRNTSKARLFSPASSASSGSYTALTGAFEKKQLRINTRSPVTYSVGRASFLVQVARRICLPRFDVATVAVAASARRVHLNDSPKRTLELYNLMTKCLFSFPVRTRYLCVRCALRLKQSIHSTHVGSNAQSLKQKAKA